MLPQLYDVDDLPDPAYDPNYVHVLTDKEQADLHKRTYARPVSGECLLLILSLHVLSLEQVKFRESQTWYRPHGTETHRVSISSRFEEVLMSTDPGISYQVYLVNLYANLPNVKDFWQYCASYLLVYRWKFFLSNYLMRHHVGP